MNKALLIDPSIALEKVAYDTRLEDEPEEWPVTVIRESHKQLPFLKDYETEVEFDKLDGARGYAVGKMLIWPPRMQKQAAAQSRQLITVPVIIRDREMAPLDVYTHLGHMQPMDQDKVAEVLFRPQAIEGAVPRGKMLGTNLYGNLIPPNTDHQYNAGTLHKHGSAKGKRSRGQQVKKDFGSAPAKTISREDALRAVVMSDLKHGKAIGASREQQLKEYEAMRAAGAKTASALWQQAVLTFRSEDVNAFGEKLASHSGLRHAYTSTPVLRAAMADMLRAVESEKTASAKREERLTHLKPTVVQLREEGKGYVVKTANHHCFQPLEHKVSRFEAQEMLSKEAFDCLLNKGRVTLTTEATNTDRAQEKVASEADQLGVYKVWRSGRALEGVVIPKVVDFDGRELDMQVFAGPESHSLQEKVAGVFVRETHLQSDRPRGLGVFVYQEGPYAVATEPVDIQSTVKVAHDAGSTGQLIGTRMSTGAPLKMTVVPGLRKIAMIGNEVALPEGVRFIALNGKSSRVSSTPSDAAVFEQRKTAGVNSVELLSDGHCYALRGHNATAFPQHDMLEVEAEFALGALGLTGAQAQDAMKTAAAHGSVRIPSTRMVVPESAAAWKSLEKAASVVQLRPERLRVDLTKELAVLTSPQAEELWKQASVTLGKESVDSILALNFVTPENASLYVAYLPELEKVSSKLAELLVASRLGMDDVRESAAKNAMTQINAVVRGLEGLRERIN